MDTQEYFKILVEEIHSVVVATVNEKGLPSTRVIDIMLFDDAGLYFLTAKGKSFYKQLMDKPYISLSGMAGGSDTMSKKAITISGAVRNIGLKKRDEIFLKNRYMDEIYPSAGSRTALDVFCLYKGQGEYFDLSTDPLTRVSFAFGGEEVQQYGFIITDVCNGCGLCADKCPVNCIKEDAPFIIKQEHCLHCGICYEVCPEKAIIRANS